MGNASRDNNQVPTLIGVSTADGTTPITVYVNPTTHRMLVSASGGTPGGSDTQVQFNDGGSFGGDAGFTYNKTTDTATLSGNLQCEDLLLEDSDASHYLTITTTSNLTAARTLTLVPGDASRTITINGDATISGTNTGDQTITLTGDVTGSGTGSFAATIGSDKITEAMLKAVDTPTDEDILTYESTTGDFEWHSASEIKTAMSLGNVENTALSTWIGTTNITTLGTIGTGTWNATAIAIAKGGTGATDAATARTNLGLAIGTDIQAYNANLTTWAGKTAPSGDVVGTTDTQTLSGKTLTAPKFADLGYIADANGNELLILDTVASAVNEITLANAATGSNPILTASGGDTNIGFDFQAKGTGTYNLKGTASQAAELRLYEDTDDGSNYSAFKVGTQAGNITYTLPTADGSSGQVLSTNGSGALSWTTAGGGTPTLKVSTIFETSGRFSNSVGGSGAITYDVSGILLNTVSGTTSYCDWTALATGLSNLNQFTGNAQFSFAGGILTAPSAGDGFLGIAALSVAGTGITYTGDQLGFKLVYAASVGTLSATNANGTTETATDITSGITLTNENFYHAKMTDSTNIKYYVNKTLKATHTTNLPDSSVGSGYGQIAVSNKSTNTQWRIRGSGITFEWDVE